MDRKIIVALLMVSIVSACAPQKGQNRYDAKEVGVSHVVEFGTVRAVKTVQITGKNSGNGTFAGAGAGAGAGSYIGQSDGNAWATAGAAIVGAVAGHFAEQSLRERDGVEYTLQMQSGVVKTIVQEKNDEDPVFKTGQHIMLTQCDAGNEQVKRCAAGSQYQRLTAIDALPKLVPVKAHKRGVREKFDDFTPDSTGDDGAQ